MSRDRSDEPPTRRQVARKERRNAGDRSSDVARIMMGLPDATVNKLQLDEDLAEVIGRARAIKSPVARRRAERTLAGELRRFDIDEVEKRIANVQEMGSAEPRLFHLAENWRTRLIEDDKAAAEFPGGAVDPLPKLIEQARREKLTGKPPGAAKALFRHVRAALEHQSKVAAADED